MRQQSSLIAHAPSLFLVQVSGRLSTRHSGRTQSLTSLASTHIPPQRTKQRNATFHLPLMQMLSAWLSFLFLIINPSHTFIHISHLSFASNPAVTHSHPPHPLRVLMLRWHKLELPTSHSHSTTHPPQHTFPCSLKPSFCTDMQLPLPLPSHRHSHPTTPYFCSHTHTHIEISAYYSPTTTVTYIMYIKKGTES